MTMSNNIKMPFRKALNRRDLNINEYIIMILIFTIIVMFGAIIEGALSPGIMKLIIDNLFI